ncbi:MAG: hypothetical protein M1824_004118 [Vezdaea acicularis]|nr:MAG: hypothetical protein M1824_004118 [Vezdaea acicularis]
MDDFLERGRNPEEGGLGDRDIQDLLEKVEHRLRNHAQKPLPASYIQRHSERDSRPELQPDLKKRPYIEAKTDAAYVDSMVLQQSSTDHLSKRARNIKDIAIRKQKAKMCKTANAGSDWFNLPKTEMTVELKRDLQLLRMRSVVDPKRHYKKDNGLNKSIMPDYSHVGRVIEGPTEFFSARLHNKDRKNTFVEEILMKGDSKNGFKRKYEAIQVAKTSGKKAFYKAVRNKRAKASSTT